MTVYRRNMLPQCDLTIYRITVLIYGCVLTVYNTLYEPEDISKINLGSYTTDVCKPTDSAFGKIGFTRSVLQIVVSGLHPFWLRLHPTEPSTLNMPSCLGRFSLYIRNPGMSTNWNNFLRPFSSLLWTAVLLTIVFTSAALSASWQLATSPSGLPLRNVVCESVFRIFGNLCNQGTRNISGIEAADVKYAVCNIMLFKLVDGYKYSGST